MCCSLLLCIACWLSSVFCKIVCCMMYVVVCCVLFVVGCGLRPVALLGAYCLLYGCFRNVCCLL